MNDKHWSTKARLLLCLALPASALVEGCSAGAGAPSLDSESEAVRGGRGGSSSGSRGSSSGSGGSSSGSGGSSSGSSGSGSGGVASSSGTSGSSGATSHILLSGGSNLGDTWIWDGQSWTQQTGPGPNGFSGAIGGLLGENVVLFSTGPNPVFGGPGETWLWNVTSSTWTQASVSEPALREDAMGGTVGSQFVIYGGYDTGDNMWTWNGGQWTNTLPETVTTPGLPPDIGPTSAVFDGKLLITDGPDIWTTDGTTISPPQTFAGPHPRTGPLAATLGSTVVLFGGYDLTANDPDDAPLRETWIWNGESWTQVTTSQPPYEIGLAPAGMVAVGDSVILLASTAASGTPENQMWKWDGTSWAQMNVQGLPSFRTSSLMVAF